MFKELEGKKASNLQSAPGVLANSPSSGMISLQNKKIHVHSTTAANEEKLHTYLMSPHTKKQRKEKVEEMHYA